MKPGLEPSMSVACFRLVLSMLTSMAVSSLVVSMAMTMLPPHSPLPSLDGGQGVDERSTFLFLAMIFSLFLKRTDSDC